MSEARTTHPEKSIKAADRHEDARRPAKLM